MHELGKLLIAVGAVMLLVGVVLVVAGRIPGVGRLPGDIYVRRGNFTFYFPIATSILLSIVLSLILWLIGRR